jgi:hypothetical protein
MTPLTVLGEYAAHVVAVFLALMLLTVLVENWVECRKRRAERDAQWWNRENWMP